MSTLIVSTILLWCLVLGLAFVVLGLVRQIGVLHGRLAPAGALMVDKGVAVGQPAPQLTVADRNGQAVSFGYTNERDQLLFFLSPSCPICKSLLPALKAIARERTAQLEVVYVSDGDPEAQQALITEYGLSSNHYVVSPEVGMTYQIGKLPYAVLIDRQGMLRAKGLVNSREHLDSLFETQYLGVASLQQYLHSQPA